MKALKNNRFLAVASASLPFASSLILLLSTSAAKAQAGTWTTDASANWSTSSNWSGSVIADGADNTANFTANISAARTITLDGARTIGNIVFTDSVTSSHNLTISGANILTLDRTTGTPIIDVTQSGRVLTIGSEITGTDGLQKNGAGQLTLSGANTYGPTTFVNEGILAVTGSLNGTNGTGLTFTGTGTFNMSRAAGLSHGMGTLSLNGGDATITSTAAGATSIATLTIDSLAARAAGATANFTLATNTSSTSATPNRIVITGATNVPLASGSNNPGIFFGGTNFARYDAAGYVRAVTYGTDTNAPAALSGNATATLGSITAATDTQFTGAARATTTSGAVSGTNTNTLAVTNGSLFAVGQMITGTNIAANTYITGISSNTLTLANAGVTNAIGGTAVAAGTTLTPYNAVTAQTTASVNTLNLSGVGSSLRLAASQTLSLNGIIRSAGTAAASSVISGGAGIQTASSGGDLVVRTNLAADVLTIASTILNNGDSSLTKSGAGALLLSGTNTYAGGTYLNGGTVTVNNTNSFGANTGSVTVNGSTAINATAATRAQSFVVNAPLSVRNISAANTSATFSGVLSGSAPITVVSSALGGSSQNTIAFTNTGNTYTGDVILPATTGGSDYFSFASIGDGGNFTFARPSWREGVIHTGSSNITFNARQIALASTIGTAAGVDGNGIPVLMFQNNGTGTVTFTQPMSVPTSVSTSAFFFFGGSNSGDNTFSGLIANPGGGNTLGIGKWDAGKWVLTGANTFSGNAWVANGTLSVNAIAPSTTDQPLGKSSLIQLGNTTTTGILEFTGSANSSTNKQVQIGTAGNANITLTGGSTIANNGTGSLTFTAATFNPSQTLTAVSRTLTLGGSYDGSSDPNVIQGIIQNNNGTTGPVALAVSGSTWVLGGVNTFSGNINVTSGTLAGRAPLAFGSQASARTINIAAGATVRYDLGNIYQSFTTANVPTFTVAGTLMNNFANNNALGNVTLTGGTITATAGSANYGAFRFNATVSSSGTSTISTSDAVSGRMMLRDEGSVFDVTGGTLTISAPLAGVAREGQVGALVKSGVGDLVLSGANAYAGSTTLNAGTTTVSGSGTLGSGTAALSVNGASTVLNLNTMLDTAVGSLSGTDAAVINTGGAGRNFTVRQTLAGTYAGNIAGGGNLTLAALSNSALTLSGPLTYTGATTVNGGTLRLLYSAGSSKLSDTAPLILGGGTIELNDAGSPHTEVVGSTTLTAGTASRVTRTAGTSVLQLNAITPGVGATIDFATDNIATTDTLNTNGILGTWATVGGTSWATNATNTADGLIVAYNAFTDVARLNGSSQVIADNSANNVRIIEGTGSSANITLGAVTTAINSLNQSTDGGTSAAIIDVTGRTLRTNAVLVSTGAGALNIGTAPNSGTLTTATAGGDLILNNSSIADLTVDAVIADNTSASSLTKLGTGFVVLNGANTYTGTTTVAGGTLDLYGSITGSPIVVNGSAALSQKTTGLIAGASSVSLSTTGTSILAGANTHTGGTTLNTGILTIGHESALGTGTFSVNGGIFNTDGVVTALNGNIPQVWNGSFIFGGASALNMGTGPVTLAGNSLVNLGSNPLTIGGVISGPFSLSLAGSGTLVLNGANTHSGGVIMTGTSNSLTMVLGNANALGTGPLTLNAVSGIKIDSTVPNLVLANNNPINFQTDVSFLGTESIDLGTGPVTLLGNRTLTVSANTLTIGGAISGSGFNLGKSGPGTMVLNGSNTFTGSTIINAGNLILGNVNALGTGTLTFAGGNLDTTVVNFVNPKNNAQAWNADLNFVGTNNLDLGNGAVTMNADRVVTVNANTVSVGGIGGVFSLTKAGAGSLVVTGASTYTGGTTINDNSGTLNISGAGNLGGGTYAGAIAIGTGATLRFSSNVAASTQTLSGPITGLGNLTHAPSVNNASLALSSTGNTYSGVTAISGGRITSSPSGISPNTSFTITGSGTSGGQLLVNATGTLANNFSISGVGYVEADALTTKAGAVRFSAGTTLSGTVTLSGDARVGFISGTASATISGQITGSNDIEFYGAASGNTATHTLSLANIGTSPNDYAGDTIISSVDFSTARTGARAVISLGANDQIPNGPGKGNVMFTGADLNHISTLDLNGYNETINGVSNLAAEGANIRNNFAGPSVLSIGDADTSSSFSGLISNIATGSLAITKIGAGALTLSGANTFTGATTISAGTLILENSFALQSSPFDTLNSVVGDAANGLKTSVTTLTLGGLTGDKNLTTVFTTTSGGYSDVTALTLNPATGATPSYSGNIVDGAAGMTLTKSGAGIQTLTGVLSHTGGVTVSGGTLSLGNATNSYPATTLINAGRGIIVTANGALGATGTGNETTVTGGTNGGALGLSGGFTYSAAEKVIGSGPGHTAGSLPGFTTANRGFIQSVSGNNIFEGSVELSADGTSRIGTQDGAQLTLKGPITQGAGITTAGILFRVGNLDGDFVTLANASNSFGVDSTVFTGLAGPGYAGVRLGIDNGLPTNLTVSGFSGTGAGAAFDLAGYDQTLNGLIAGNGVGSAVCVMSVINLNTLEPSTLTLNPTADKSSGTLATNTTVIRGGDGLGVINLVKEGTFTQALTGVNTYTGTTTVNNGTLTLGNASALGTSAATVTSGALNLGGQTITNTVSIGALGTLTGSGSTGAATLAGSMTPGGTGNGLITMASATVAATSTITLQLPATGTRGTNYDAITVSDALVLDGTITVDVTGLTPAIGQSFDLIDSTGPIDVSNFAIATDLVLPTLAAGLAWDTSAFATTGVISIISGDPYLPWAALKGLTSLNNGKGADPDGDGKNNLYEFAFDGDPLSGANDGKVVGKVASVGAAQVMTLTVPVRTGATFSVSSGDQLSALIDGLYYRIEGDSDLGTFANTISEVTGADATAIQAGLPALSGGWTYRTFREAGTVTTNPKVFLRAKVSDTP